MKRLPFMTSLRFTNRAQTFTSKQAVLIGRSALSIYAGSLDVNAEFRSMVRPPFAQYLLRMTGQRLPESRSVFR
jgi:hypothetical protein